MLEYIVSVKSLHNFCFWSFYMSSVKEEFIRTAYLLGDDAVMALSRKRVAVFGVGGVGGHICEALARCGVGAIDLFDADCVSVSNINRQIVALHSTVGRPKVEVMRERILDINPTCVVNAFEVFYLPDNADEFDLSVYDYIADAVDTVKAKIELCVRAKRLGIPIICAMGAGNKLDPTGFRVSDISKTAVCPLAKVMRRELKARGIYHLKVVYSEEQPSKVAGADEPMPEGKRSVPGSLAFVPSVMGLIMGGEIVKDLVKQSTSIL